LYNHNLEGNINTMQFLNDLVGYVAGNGFVAKTTDGGKNWAKLPSVNSSGNWLALYFYDQNRGIISTGISSALLTTDGGITWSSRPETAKASGYAFANGITYAVAFESGNNGVINLSADRGDTWQRVHFSCGALRGITASPDGETIYVVGDGGHIERIPANSLSTATRNPAGTTLSLKAYPNPTFGSLTLEIPSHSTASLLTVFSSDGRQVMEWNTAGAGPVLEIDLSSQPPGIYYLRWTEKKGMQHLGRVILR
jgi:photosystem II stability/assembly factor-like uncharacterized protein